MRFVFIAILLSAGCKVAPPKPPLVETIAILPFNNGSNDVHADTIMQRLVYLALNPTAYRVSDIDQTNEFLKSKGISDGGQLPALDPVKIGKDLGVHGLLYGSVESFSYTNIGFYQQRKVELALRLVDASTGGILWENTKTAAVRNLTLDKDEAGKNFVKGLATQTVDKLFNSPLEEEAKLATIKTLSSLPGFSFHGFGKDTSAGKNFMKQIINNKK